MESKVKALGHPIHPMLIVFPLGLLATAVVFDILYLMLGVPEFPLVAFWLVIAGIIGGLTAAVFGFADWLAIPGETRAKSVGLMHGIGNVVVVLLFAISWFLRLNASGYVPSTMALVFSFAGAILAMFTGWLGGELVYRLGMAVDPGANLNAPSSLSDQPAVASSPLSRPSGYQPAIPLTGRPTEDEDDQPKDH